MPLLDRAAPEFSTSTLDGATWRLADQRGKVVVLDFWASWCKPCIEAIPTLRDVYRRHRDHPDFVMMGVSLDSERAALTRSMERHDVEWAQLYEDGEGWQMSVAKLYGVRAIPHVLVIDRQGVVRANPRARQLGAEVARLLDAEPAVRGAGLEGVVLYRGAPLSKWTARDPRWSIWDDERRTYSSGEEVDYSPATGRIEMRGVPHRGTVYVTFPTADTDGGLDDAFHASARYDLGRSRKIELAAERVLLLHEPWASTENRDYAAGGNDYRTFTSPLRFDWEPVEDAARYRLQVIRSRDGEHSEGYGYLDTAVDNSLEGTTLAAHLAPSNTLEHYEFMIFAYDDSDDVVARYMVNYEGRFLRRAHPFKIGPSD